MAAPHLPTETGPYVVEFAVTLFFTVLTALGVVFRMYIGRITQRLDQVAKRLELVEADRVRRWEDHIEQNNLRALDIEKRLSRCELITETLFKTVGSCPTVAPLQRTLEVFDKEDEKKPIKGVLY